MKHLLLIRHAKSDWNDSSLADVDRPLNERGKHDAPLMAVRLKKKAGRIDAFISSPAKRARKTAAIFAKEFGQDKESVILKADLYLAPAEIFQALMPTLKDKVDTVAIFAHNPGITEFANTLTGTRIDNIPTCGIFAVKIKAKKWQDFDKAEKEFWFADFPKATMD